jgi:molybdopterin/thiamine biosynthesis adenylyltransferase
MNERFSRQVAFNDIGSAGQDIIGNSTIGVLGCGALGTNILDLCIQMGFKRIVVADDDFIEISNLQRQKLYYEVDVGKAKVLAAQEKLQQMNSQTEIVVHQIRVTLQNFAEIYGECDLIFDASDCFETRFMLNHAAAELNKPWVFSGITASSGQSYLIIPKKTPCLKCIVHTEKAPEEYPDVYKNGIIATIGTLISSISVTKGLRYLIERKPDPFMVYVDIWKQDLKKFKIYTDDDCGCIHF